MRTPEERLREGEVRAVMLYAEEALLEHPDGYEVIGPALRGRMTLLSCYFPAWWFIACSECHELSPSERNPDEDRLQRWADNHRCNPYELLVIQTRIAQHRSIASGEPTITTQRQRTT